MTRTDTAYHEAGHAVAFYRLFPDGRCGGTLSIVPREAEGIAGTHSAEELLDCDASESEKEAVYACAGYAALMAAGYPVDVSEEGCESDFEKAERCSGRPLGEIKKEAVVLLAQPENRRAVQRLADALLERETLDDDLATILLALSDGLMTESEFQDYLVLRHEV